MPTWCENRLTVSGPANVISEIVRATGLNRGAFDFNGIVPMPEDMKIVGHPTTQSEEDVLRGNWQSVLDIPSIREAFLSTYGVLPDSQEAMIDMIDRAHAAHEAPSAEGKSRFPLHLGQARQERRNYREYGFKNWHDWSVINWGTRWNVAEVRIEVLEPRLFIIDFSTATTPPIPIVKVLCRRFPEIQAQLDYANDNCGLAGKFGGANGSVWHESEDGVKEFCEEEPQRVRHPDNDDFDLSLIFN